MKFKKLGTTDLDVSLICLGTMTWGTQNTEKDAFDQMDYSLESGINFSKALRTLSKLFQSPSSLSKV